MSTGLIIAVIVGVSLLVLAAAAVLLFRWMTARPLYNPGDVSAGKNLRASLSPPDQPDDPHLWAVEEDTHLHHFSAGSGRNVLMIHGGPGIRPGQFLNIHGGPGYPFLEPWTGLEPLTSSYCFHYYDQRGCGHSTRPVDSLTSTNTYKIIQHLESTLGVGAQLADIERIRQILGEEQLILIGQSFGSFIASLYAAEFPSHVQAMVLVAPADMLLMPPAHGGLFEEVQKRLPDDMQTSYAAYLEEYFNFKGLFDKSEAELAEFNGRFATYYRAIYDLPAGEDGDPGGWMVQAQYFNEQVPGIV